jgi:hypothetical protein
MCSIIEQEAVKVEGCRTFLLKKIQETKQYNDCSIVNCLLQVPLLASLHQKYIHSNSNTVDAVVHE